MKSEKLKLTEAVVSKFKCPAGERQAFLWDTEQPGLGVRALPGYTKNGRPVPGAKTWVVQGRIAGGAERRITLGPVAEIWLAARSEREADAERDEPDDKKVSARELARRKRRQMAEGLDPLVEQARVREHASADFERGKAEAVSLRATADHYIANKKTRNGPLKANTIRDINEVVDKAFAAWSARPIKSITRTMCEARHKELATGGLTGERPAPARARGSFVVLRALINWAMDKFRDGDDQPLIRENPVNVLKGQMAPTKVRTTKVPMGRIGHVWEALQRIRADPYQLQTTHTQADALAFMLLVGARKEEALQLTWDRVELSEDAGTWHLPDPKNRVPITLPLSAPARALLANRPRRKGCNWVFPGRDWKRPMSTPRGPAMSQAIAAAGCHLDRHALRRTMTTLAVTVLDIPLWRVELLTGHKLAGNVTLNHYTETSDLSYLAPEAERIAAWIVEQANIAAGRNVVQLGKKKRA